MSSTVVARNALDPFEWYRLMSNEAAVHRDEQGSTWGVFRYDEIVQVLKDPTTYSNIAPITASDLLKSTTVLSDPPRHAFLRSALISRFSPKAIDSLKPRIAEIVNKLIDSVQGAGEMDFMRDFAVPLPILVVADILGIPGEDFRRFKSWCDRTVSNAKPSEDGIVRFERGTFTLSRESFGDGEVMDYFVDLARKRRQDPKDDVLSALAVAQIEGRLLTDRELAANCFQLLLAGNETTTNLMACAVMSLDENPQAWNDIRADASLIPSMLEEVLRFRSSVHGVVRRTTREVELGGQMIPSDELLMAWIASGNRDPRRFQNPDVFDIRRRPNPHLGLGQGIHFCIGAPLARLEARLAFEVLLNRFQDMHVRSATTLVPIPSITLYGVKTLPVTFRAAA